MDKVLIELVGLPGSGKTSYAVNSKYSVVQIASRQERWYWAVVFMKNHPRLFLQLARLTWRETKALSLRLQKHKFAFIFLTACAKEAKAEKAEADTIIDEGLYQYVISLYEHEISLASITNDCDTLLRLRREVYIFDAPLTERTKRMEKRGQSFRGGFSADYQKAFAALIEKNFLIIKEYYYKNKLVTATFEV